MPKKNKDQESQKSKVKKKEAALTNATFGLKNKNKSNKVKAHVASITQSIQNSGDRKEMAKKEQVSERSERALRKRSIHPPIHY